MLERAVLPDLRRRSGEPSVIASRVLRTWGESESGLDERLARRHHPARRARATPPSPSWPAAGRASRCASRPRRPTRRRRRRRRWPGGRPRSGTLLGPLVFGVRRRHDGVGGARPAARSGGSRSAWPSRSPAASSPPGSPSVPGASDVFRGSIVSYASEVKFDLLGVPRGAGRVARGGRPRWPSGARRVLGADVGLSLTGVAGPTEQDGQPVGTLHVGLAIGDGVEHGVAAAARHARPDAPVLRDLVARPAPPPPPRDNLSLRATRASECVPASRRSRSSRSSRRSRGTDAFIGQ